MHKTGTKKQKALGAFLGKRHCAVALTKQILTKKDDFLGCTPKVGQIFNN